MTNQHVDERHGALMRGVSSSWRRIRRSRSSIDRAGAGARLTQLLDERPILTFDEIVATMHSEGFKLSRSAINRWYRRHYDEPSRAERQEEIHAELPPTNRHGEVLAIEERNTALLQSQMLAHLQTKQTVDQETLEISRAVSALATAAAQREKVRMVRDRGIRTATKLIKNDIRRELKNHPDVMKKMIEIADAVEAELLKKNNIE